jgi:chromosome segregation ATPase
MSEDMKAELQHWQARTDEMQVAMERLREERDIWKVTCETQTILLNKQEDQIKQLRSMIERIQVAMSQGQEL